MVCPVPGLAQPFPMRLPKLPARSNSSTDGREPRLWEIGERAQLASLVVGWVDTWPAFGLGHCGIVSDRAHYMHRGQTWPPELAHEYSALHREYPQHAEALFGEVLDPNQLDMDLYRRVEGEKDRAKMPRYQQLAREQMGVELDPDHARLAPDDSRHLAGQLILSQARELDKDAFYFDAAKRLLSEARAKSAFPPLCAFYFSQTDTVQHLFWQFHEPSAFPAVRPELVAQLADVIPRAYENADRMLGEILELAGPSATVVIVSDHGGGAWSELFGGWDPFQSGELHLGYSGNHRRNGILLAQGPGIRAGIAAEDMSIYDVTPLVLHLLGLPVADNMPGAVPIAILDGAVSGLGTVARVRDYGRRVVPKTVDGAIDETDATYQQRLAELGYTDSQ
jgi:hypothetical protein